MTLTRRRFATLTSVLVLALVSWLPAGCAVPGIALLHVDWMQDDALVLRTYYEDPDARPADDARDYLATCPIMAEDDRQLAPSAGDPLRAELVGALRVVILHTDAVRATITADRIALIRDAADDQRWYLAPGELERLTRD